MESLDDPPHSSASNKRVLLRRSLQAVPSSSEILDPDDKSEIGRDSPSRRVLLAHKIKPGQTIQLKGTKATATMRDDGQPDLHTESLVQRGPVGPMQDENGMLLSFSVLGPVEEFEEQAAGMTGHVYPPAASTSTMMPPPPHHPRLDQLEAMEEVMRLKGESASQRQLTAESLRQKQLRTWHSQIGELSKSLKVPPAHLMMARTGDYRTKVQQREVLEALRRRQYPYGGERAWQIGLRNGGVFYEAIGNASNGIFCPFRAPDDSNALARAGALAQQAPADLTLAALESKILGERRGLMADEEALGMTGALSEAAPTGGGFEEPDIADQPPPYPEDDDDDDYIDPEAFDVIGEAHLAEIARLRDKYNIEGAAPAHLSGDERVLWGIFKEIDTDESGSVSKQELYAAFAKVCMYVCMHARRLCQGMHVCMHACTPPLPRYAGRRLPLRSPVFPLNDACPNADLAVPGRPSLVRWVLSPRLPRCCACFGKATPTATDASTVTSSSRSARRWTCLPVRPRRLRPRIRA